MKIVPIILLMLIAQCASAFDIAGGWQSNKEKSIEWNTDHLKLPEESIEFQLNNFGHLYFIFNKSGFFKAFESYSSKYKESVHENKALAIPIGPYEVPYQNAEFLVVKPLGSPHPGFIIYIENEASIYVLGSNGSREYFTRVPVSKAEAVLAEGVKNGTK
jgi:hypothetical protein